MPINSQKEIPNFASLDDMDLYLRTEGCRMCNLGFQSTINGCCVMRGNTQSHYMILGEGPGKEEDSSRRPWTGPAGLLLNQVWQSVGMNTNDWYIGNVVKCRPVAPSNSGKQNLTPSSEQRARCRLYLDIELKLLKPKLIAAMGKVAIEAILGQKNITVKNYRGKLFDCPYIEGCKVFPMIHTAAILHSTSTPQYDIYRQHTWEDIQKLKNIIKEIENG